MLRYKVGDVFVENVLAVLIVIDMVSNQTVFADKGLVFAAKYCYKLISMGLTENQGYLRPFLD